MNGYLITAGLTNSQVRPTRDRRGQMVDMFQTWDSCVSAILYGGSLKQAQKKFEARCQATAEGENPIEVEIKRIVAAQFVDQLLTESGTSPLDWPQISQQAYDALQTVHADDFEQGYWVDINQVVPPGKISFDSESLKRGLPEDIQSGLNWSPEKKFFFLVAVLSPLPEPVMPADELESPPPDDDQADAETQTDGQPDLDGFIAALPEMRDKEAAALVEARNSVVAAWLWRKYAADSRLAANEIHIAPCCAFVPVE